jgi:hypothetical protein
MSMAAQEYLTPNQIRDAFFAELSARGVQQLAYADLWSALRSQGQAVRGSSPKKQRDTVYRALASSNRIERIAPGVFARR